MHRKVQGMPTKLLTVDSPCGWETVILLLIIFWYYYMVYNEYILLLQLKKHEARNNSSHHLLTRHYAGPFTLTSSFHPPHDSVAWHYHYTSAIIGKLRLKEDRQLVNGRVRN